MLTGLMQKCAPVLAATALLSGCFHGAVAVAPATRPLEQGGYRDLGPVSGSDCLWSLFGVLPISTGNTLQRALVDALEERPGADALVQVTADTFFEHYIVVARACTQVEGIAVESRSRARKE
jgi:hypothetical protein